MASPDAAASDHFRRQSSPACHGCSRTRGVRQDEKRRRTPPGPAAALYTAPLHGQSPPKPPDTPPSASHGGQSYPHTPVSHLYLSTWYPSSTVPTQGGHCGQGASNPIAQNCGKLRENCGALTNPPQASRSHTRRTGEDVCLLTAQGREVLKLGKFCTAPEIPNVF